MAFNVLRVRRSQLVERVCLDFLDMRNLPVSMVYQGWDHAVIIFADRFVFRFPKSTEYRKKLRHEINFLKRFEPRFNIKVPQYTYLSRRGDYAGYAAIPGQEFWPAQFARLTQQQKDATARSLAQFMKTLHAIPVAALRTYKFSHGLVSDYRSIKSRYLKKVRGHLSDKEQVCVAQFLKEYETEFLTGKTRLALVHTDLTPDHIFFDRKKHKLTGVIDFSDMQIDTPARDFHRLHVYGEKFVARVLHYYGRGKDPIFVKQVDLEQKLITLDRLIDVESGEPMNRIAEWRNFRKVFGL